MTRALALVVGRDGITVNCLCPGWTDTPHNDWVSVGARMGGLPPEQARARGESENAQGRILRPDELGPMAVLLASAGARGSPVRCSASTAAGRSELAAATAGRGPVVPPRGRRARPPRARCRSACAARPAPPTLRGAAVAYRPGYAGRSSNQSQLHGWIGYSAVEHTVSATGSSR